MLRSTPFTLNFFRYKLNFSFAEMAFKRNSVKMATEWEKHTNEYLPIKKPNDAIEADQLQAAYWGMAAIGALGAMYIYKKIRK